MDKVIYKPPFIKHNRQAGDKVWIKLVTEVDRTQAGGYRYKGEFLNGGKKYALYPGSVILSHVKWGNAPGAVVEVGIVGPNGELEVVKKSFASDWVEQIEDFEYTLESKNFGSHSTVMIQDRHRGIDAAVRLWKGILCFEGKTVADGLPGTVLTLSSTMRVIPMNSPSFPAPAALRIDIENEMQAARERVEHGFGDAEFADGYVTALEWVLEKL